MERWGLATPEVSTLPDLTNGNRGFGLAFVYASEGFKLGNSHHARGGSEHRSSQNLFWCKPALAKCPGAYQRHHRNCDGEGSDAERARGSEGGHLQRQELLLRHIAAVEIGQRPEK